MEQPTLKTRMDAPLGATAIIQTIDLTAWAMFGWGLVETVDGGHVLVRRIHY